MAFDWNSYQPETGGITGQPTVDPSQLQVQSPTWGYQYGPNGAPLGDTGSVPTGGMTGSSVSFDPSQASPSSPMAGGGGINPGGMGTTPNQTMQPTGGGQDPQAFFNQLFPGDTLTPDMLTQNEAALNAQGITLVKNAAGVPGKIKLPNGQVVDVIQGAGSGLNKKQWLTGDGGSGMGTLGGLGSGYMTSPIGQFTPPSAQDAMNSPGTQYSLDEAMRAMQNSAAAKGTLLNGRTLQGELGALSNLAAGQYNDVYNRAANTFGINFGVQTRNQDAPFDKYYKLSDLGQRAASAS